MSPSVNGNRHVIDSFAPLGELLSLESLVCFPVVARDRVLSVLHSLPKLAEVEIPSVYSTEQIARLAGAG